MAGGTFLLALCSTGETESTHFHCIHMPPTMTVKPWHAIDTFSLTHNIRKAPTPRARCPSRNTTADHTVPNLGIGSHEEASLDIACRNLVRLMKANHRPRDPWAMEVSSPRGICLITVGVQMLACARWQSAPWGTSMKIKEMEDALGAQAA
jgi:hypothetical protein